MLRHRGTGRIDAPRALAGRGASVRIAVAGPGHPATGRPHPSDYCYDCHGYRYFDADYDWCVGDGFDDGRGRHPEVTTLERARCLGIRESDPECALPGTVSDEAWRRGRKVAQDAA